MHPGERPAAPPVQPASCSWVSPYWLLWQATDTADVLRSCARWRAPCPACPAGSRWTLSWRQPSTGLLTSGVGTLAALIAQFSIAAFSTALLHISLPLPSPLWFFFQTCMLHWRQRRIRAAATAPACLQRRLARPPAAPKFLAAAAAARLLPVAAAALPRLPPPSAAAAGAAPAPPAAPLPAHPAGSLQYQAVQWHHGSTKSSQLG